MTNQQQPRSKRALAEEKLKIARSNLLLVIALTLINIILSLTGSDSMMLFSATIPYFLAILATAIPGFLAIGLGSAAVILLLYLLCWIFSKKHYGWMVVALVLFLLDTVFLAWIYITAGDFSGILDAAIHVWVFYYLIIGVKYGHQLKTLPAESELIPEESFSEEALSEEAYPADVTQDFEHTSPIRRADEDVKSRVLLEYDYAGHHICYRRVKRVNELVIDGYVYDEIEVLVEYAHALNAKIDNHTIQVGFDGFAHSYLKVDGEKVAKKLRLY